MMKKESHYKYRNLIKLNKHKKTWVKYFANELGRLAQVVGCRVKCTESFFLSHAKIPTKRRKYVTYGQIVCNYRPQNDEPHRIRLVVGGNLISFLGDVRTRTVDITTAKQFLNITISTKGAQFL